MREINETKMSTEKEREMSERIAAWLTERYGAKFSSAACELLRSYTNDVYLIRSAHEKFVLKVYGLGWRTDAEVRYEVELIRHLLAHDVPVAIPIDGLNRDPIQSMATETGHRVAVLSTYVPGDKPQPRFSLDLYEEFGRAIARFHQAADSFVTSSPRQALDTIMLIDQPVALASSLLSNSNDRTWLHHFAQVVKERIEVYAAAGLEWGPIHGDATLDNLHVTDDGMVILFDFDSGGPGWRASDLQGWAANHVDYQPRWNAFHRGYNQVRPLVEVNRMAAPYLAVAWDIWGLKVDLERRIIPKGPKQVQDYLSTQLAVLRWQCSQLGLT